MKEGYRFLGEYIRQVDIRNKEGKKENLLGVSVQKQFIQSIANTVGTDFTKYKVVKKGQFTYIPDTSRRGDKIAIALLEDYEEGLVSNVYTVFEVIDTEKLLPEYLMLWFSRPEFDRYARFKSHGSVREVMDWEEMCKVELPVPDIEKQRKIVKAYKTITDRIALKQKINDSLLKAPKEIKRNIRAMLHYEVVTGDYTMNDKIRGYIAYVDSIEKNYKNKCISYLQKLSKSTLCLFPDVVKAYNSNKIYKELPDMKEKRAIDFVDLEDADDFFDMVYYEHKEYLISKGLLNKMEKFVDFHTTI